MTDLDALILRHRRYHEAAHAVIAVAFGYLLDTVSVIPGAHWRGLTVYRRPPGPPAPPEVMALYDEMRAELATQAEVGPQEPPPIMLRSPAKRSVMEMQIVCDLAGVVAEEYLATPDGFTEELTSDQRSAEKLAQELARTSPRHAELVRDHGPTETTTDRQGAEGRSAELAGKEGGLHLALMYAVTERMVADRWPQITALADALRTHPILDGPSAEGVIASVHPSTPSTKGD